MTLEIIGRVNAWLADNSDWARASRERWGLRVKFGVLSREWVERGGLDAGTEAAMRGVLLALAGEAWGQDVGLDFDRGQWRVLLHEAQQMRRGVRWLRSVAAYGATKDGALVVALEAAPK